MSLKTPSFEIRMAEFEVAERDIFLADLRRIAGHAGTTLVCFDAENLAGKRHAEAAILHALRSWNAGSGVANSFEMEALLFASGSRQCSVAASFGVHGGKNCSYICCCPPREGVWDALAPLVRYIKDTGGSPKGVHRARLKELFFISDEEIAAAGESKFTDLVLERVALLEVYR